MASTRWPCSAVSGEDLERWSDAVNVIAKADRMQRHLMVWAVSVLWHVMRRRLPKLQEQQISFGHACNPRVQQLQEHVCGLFPELQGKLTPHPFRYVPFNDVCAALRDALRVHMEQQQQEAAHQQMYVTSRLGARFGMPWLCTPNHMAFLLPCAWFLMLFDDDTVEDRGSSFVDSQACVLTLMFPLHACRGESPIDMFQRLRIASTLYRMIVASGHLSRQHDQWSVAFGAIEVSASRNALTQFARNVSNVVARWARPNVATPPLPENETDVQVLHAQDKTEHAVDQLIQFAVETAPYLVEAVVQPSTKRFGSPWHTSPRGIPRISLFRQETLSARVRVQWRANDPQQYLVPPCPARVHTGACCALLGGVPSFVLSGHHHAKVRKSLASACRLLPVQEHRQLLCYVLLPSSPPCVVLFVREHTWESASKPTRERLLRLFTQLRRLA